MMGILITIIALVTIGLVLYETLKDKITWDELKQFIKDSLEALPEIKIKRNQEIKQDYVEEKISLTMPTLPKSRNLNKPRIPINDRRKYSFDSKEELFKPDDFERWYKNSIYNK